MAQCAGDKTIECTRTNLKKGISLTLPISGLRKFNYYLPT